MAAPLFRWVLRSDLSYSELHGIFHRSRAHGDHQIDQLPHPICTVCGHRGRGEGESSKHMEVPDVFACDRVQVSPGRPLWYFRLLCLASDPFCRPRLPSSFSSSLYLPVFEGTFLQCSIEQLVRMTNIRT